MTNLWTFTCPHHSNVNLYEHEHEEVCEWFCRYGASPLIFPDKTLHYFEEEFDERAGHVLCAVYFDLGRARFFFNF